MNTSLLKTISVAALCAGTLFHAQAALKVGDNFPDFAAFKIEGKIPDAWKGKVVLVDFWASWCGPCKESFPAMNDIQKKYAGRGVVVIGINEDEQAADMQDFLKSNPATFTVVRDVGQKLVAEAGVATMPGSFILDDTGKIRFAHNGFHGAKTAKQYDEEIGSLLKK